MPVDLEKTMKAAASRDRLASVQGVVSVGVALVLGMPEEMREKLLLWASMMAQKDPNLINEHDAWRVFEAVQRSIVERSSKPPEEVSTDWYIEEVLGVEEKRPGLNP